MGEIYRVGIDLGTSRTSGSSSIGTKATITTVVGYVKDHIAEKVLGAKYLVGEKALDNRLALNLLWPLAEGVIKSNDNDAMGATRVILKELITLLLPNLAKEDEIYAVIGVPALASKESKKYILEASEGIVHKCLVTPEPFMVAFGIDKLKDCVMVDIGAGSADILMLTGALPKNEDSVSLNTAGNYLDNTLKKLLEKEFEGVQLSKRMVKNIKEKHSNVNTSLEKTIITLQIAGKPTECDITAILKKACLALTNPLAEGVQKLIAGFDPEFQEIMRNNIIIAGGGSRLTGIDRFFEKALIEYGGGQVRTIEDSEYAGCSGGLVMAKEIDPAMWSQI